MLRPYADLTRACFSITREPVGGVAAARSEFLRGVREQQATNFVKVNSTSAVESEGGGTPVAPLHGPGGAEAGFLGVDFVLRARALGSGSLPQGTAALRRLVRT